MYVNQNRLLSERRRALGLSIREVSFRLGVSHNYYYKIERGRDIITPKIAKKLTIILGLKTRDILEVLNKDFILKMDTSETIRTVTNEG